MAKKQYSATEYGQAMQEEFSKNNDKFFSFAWREAESEILEKASRFEKLAVWLDKEIELCSDLINIFCPADKTEIYTNSMKEEYLSQVQKFAVLIHLRELLIDSRTTNKQRENIEYTLEKLYGVRYSKEFEDFI